MIRLTVNNLLFRITILASIMFGFKPGFSQPECRSVLGAHLKPFSDNFPLNWASEFTVSPGFMKDRIIFNGMAYLGLDYTSKSKIHQFYFEGAYKYWFNSSNGPGVSGTGTGFSDFNSPEKKNLGFRELFYSYSNGFIIKTGIQSMKSTGSMLLDERVLGISVKRDFNRVRFSFQGGTVFDDIARMQDVCGTRHVYNLLRGSKVNFVGDNMLDSNFLLAELNWTPGEGSAGKAPGTDEFAPIESSGEFSEFSGTGGKASGFKIKNFGFRVYEEFGKVFPDYKVYTGSNLRMELFNFFQLDAEAILQMMKENNAFIWKLGLQKEIFRTNGSFTSFRTEYLGNFGFNGKENHFPAFSNLFKGEVMRLDMMHMPLLELEVNHRFADSWKSAIKCSYIHQLTRDKSRELDMVYSMQPWKHLNLNAIGSYMQSNLLDGNNFLFKLEARFAF